MANKNSVRHGYEEQNSIRDNVDELEKPRPIRCIKCEKLTAYKTHSDPPNHCTSCNYAWGGYGYWLQKSLTGEKYYVREPKLIENLSKIINTLGVPLGLATMAGIAMLLGAVCNR